MRRCLSGLACAAAAARERLPLWPPTVPWGADIPELSDAAQEFLTDWLVRHNYDEAMEFISDESLTCLVISPESTLKKGTRKAMREVLEASGKRVGEHSSLSTVISAARAWGPNIRKLDHRYSQEFDLVEVTDSIGESSLCRNRKERVPARTKDRTGFW